MAAVAEQHGGPADGGRREAWTMLLRHMLNFLAATSY